MTTIERHDARPLVRIDGLSKRYADHLVLDDVSLDLLPGEVHALLGGNGAGKSTLIKVLAAVVPASGGTITVRDDETSIGSPAEGVAFVHQDLGLIASMTVAENIALTVGFSRRRGLVSHELTHRHAARLLATIGVDVDPAALVGDLPQDARVMVAVARAFGADAHTIVLDEVSSSLPAPEAARLAASLRSAAATGIAFLYVTHRLDELDGLADRVTVLRDGRLITTRPYRHADHGALVEMIVGGQHTVPSRQATRRRHDLGEGLKVTGLSGSALRTPIDLDVAPGEIVAVCGLVGCGSRDLATILGGAVKAASGSAQLDGRELPLGDPAAMRARGCTYVPGDRHGEGAVPDMSIRENFFLSRHGDETPRESRFIQRRREQSETGRMVERYDVRPRLHSDRPLAALSGGNQQKVVVARAIRCGPRLLVVDDPTAGVDVQARADLHAIVRSAADDGAAVVLSSTDYDEVAVLADRALVLAGGRVVAVLEGDQITADALARHSYEAPSTLRPETS
jgi:ribose transport system ATP-binding protein